MNKLFGRSNSGREIKQADKKFQDDNPYKEYQVNYTRKPDEEEKYEDKPMTISSKTNASFKK